MLVATLHITLPDGDGNDGLDEYRHFAPILLALDAMVAVNLWHIRRALKRAEKGLGAPVPPLYASGVIYKEDPPGEENWCDLYVVMQMGHGDCDRLCAWRIAELRAAGIEAQPLIKWQKVPKDVMMSMGHPANMIPDVGVDMVHVQVQWPDGHIEDPSKLLGMGGNFTNGV